MFFKIHKNTKGHPVHLIDQEDQLKSLSLSKQEIDFIKSQIKQKQFLIHLNHYDQHIFFQYLDTKSTEEAMMESIRKQGAGLLSSLLQFNIEEITIINHSASNNAAYCFAEGLALSNYQFLKYKKDAKKLKNTFESIYFSKESLSSKELQQLKAVVEAIYIVRDLINEPLQYLSATQLSQDIEKIGKEAAFKVTVYEEKRIQQMKMGGLLAVNRGSKNPPTFTIMEHRSLKAKNRPPIVLVGKGVVYDTGGLSLKPTANSMDKMKSDMSGAALVTGIMYVAAQLDLPVNLIALVPATDNRPGEDAYVPGDVITMYDGTTVEVLNTDAEGRLILADALHYAKKYKPELVLDFATLTGAAANAIGDAGIVCMGNADESVKQQLKHSGENQYERLIEFPLWQEYEEMIKSDIADLKNIGGPVGGAITAGQFLKHFTDYPWMHFDIAGVSFRDNKKDYRTTGGTGYGIRMMIDFLLNHSPH